MYLSTYMYPFILNHAPRLPIKRVLHDALVAVLGIDHIPLRAVAILVQPPDTLQPLRARPHVRPPHHQ